MDFEPEYMTTFADGIEISACQAFLEEEDNGCGFYVRIENNTDEKIRILGRDLRITDERGNSFYNSGCGFKGEIPELSPGEYFEFADCAPVDVAFGVLYGSCQIEADSARTVKEIKIPAIPMVGHKSGHSFFN